MKRSITLSLVSPLSALALALALAGCTTAPALPKPDLAVPAAYKEAPVASTEGQWKPALPAEAMARGAWWQVFDDAQLDALVGEATAANPTLASAAARVQAARSSLRGVQADRWPQLTLGAGASRSRSLPAGAPPVAATGYQATLGAGYEIDLFRRVQNGVDAAQADADQAQAAYRSVLLALQGDVAQTWFALRTTDAEIAQLDATVGLREANLRLIDSRFRNGDVAEFDLARARTELATAQAERAALRGQRSKLEHTLALLLGRAPSTFTLNAQPLGNAVVPEVPAGLPSQLLERRPDVTAAERAMAAATARVGVARSAMFPALALTADGGFASGQLEDLFKWSGRAWLASVVFSLPVLDGGRNKAAVSRAEAQLEGAVADYRGAVLAAFADVEDQLSGLRAVREQVTHADTAVASARRAAQLADSRYRAGADSYLQLIETQRDLLAVERQAVKLRGAWASTTVGLIRSLGGGWQAP